MRVDEHWSLSKSESCSFLLAASDINFGLRFTLNHSLCSGESLILHSKKFMSCNRLLKTGCNSIVGATLFQVINNIEQYC